MELSVKEGFNFGLIDEDGESQIRISLLPEKTTKFKTRKLKGRSPLVDETFSFPGIEQGL